MISACMHRRIHLYSPSSIIMISVVFIKVVMLGSGTIHSLNVSVSSGTLSLIMFERIDLQSVLL